MRLVGQTVAALRSAGSFLRNPGLSLGTEPGEPRCAACGRPTLYLSHRVLDHNLVTAWELDAGWAQAFDRRESGLCLWCWSNARSRRLAEVITAHFEFNGPFRSLVQSSAFRSRRVAEINACGSLHQFLVRAPNVTSSEFHPRRSGVRHEDLTQLSYADASFDLCLTSETLEHVPDVRRALAEIRRVLAPGGWHIFTTPVVWNRAHSRTRAEMTAAGGVRLLAPPSYHGCGPRKEDYLVVTEFGADVVDLVRGAGFSVTVRHDAHNPALAAFVTQRTPE
ncbi:MAG: methyltransferase domain-containing protein [Chloroflexi bacterium]|nr:methyltransferase domain-containing protein [Chloroflexota bacterium]